MSPARQSADVIIVGSGAAGMFAAVLADELGLSAIVIEKAAQYGGTSAVSGGGIWIPNHDGLRDRDSEEQALTYLRACGAHDEARIGAYVADAPRAMRALQNVARVGMTPNPGFPDYLSRLPGAGVERVLSPDPIDGKQLGAAFEEMRPTFPYLKLLGRLSLTNGEAGMLSVKAPGWKAMLFGLLRRYWLDLPWRLRTRRDRRLTNGEALVGGLRKAMLDRGIPLLLNTTLVALERDGDRVNGIIAERGGSKLRYTAKRGVLIAAGGFEGNPSMRKQHLDPRTPDWSSAAPRGMNRGDGISAGVAAGAAIAEMGLAWKAPVISVPDASQPDGILVQPYFWERGSPGAICVNRRGERFVDEGCSYDEFAAAMLTDDDRTGASLPAWIIFDADARARHLIGPLMPSELKPDAKLPRDWLGKVYHRADSITQLAQQIGVDPHRLGATVAIFNADAAKGIDSQFDRGGCAYDAYFADPRVKPNGNLAPLAKAPFYAMRIDVGELGTKGGLVVDAAHRVLDAAAVPLPGLFATGNSSMSPFGNAYPGAGATLGPAITGALVAVEAMANRRIDA